MSSLSINLIVSYYLCQSRHHTYGTSLPNHLEIKVAIMLADQTNEMYR